MAAPTSGRMLISTVRSGNRRTAVHGDRFQHPPLINTTGLQPAVNGCDFTPATRTTNVRPRTITINVIAPNSLHRGVISKTAPHNISKRYSPVARTSNHVLKRFFSYTITFATTDPSIASSAPITITAKTVYERHVILPPSPTLTSPAPRRIRRRRPVVNNASQFVARRHLFSHVSSYARRPQPVQNTSAQRHQPQRKNPICQPRCRTSLVDELQRRFRRLHPVLKRPDHRNARATKPHVDSPLRYRTAIIRSIVAPHNGKTPHRSPHRSPKRRLPPHRACPSSNVRSTENRTVKDDRPTFQTNQFSSLRQDRKCRLPER